MKVKILGYEFENIGELAKRLRLSDEETEKLVELYKNTENMKLDTSPKKDTEGKLVLPKGTVLHGVAFYGRLGKIAKEGLLAGAILHDTVGDYGVNGWIVEEEQSMKEFYDDYNTPINKGGSHKYKDFETGEIKSFNHKAKFLPVEEKYSKGLSLMGEVSHVAFIIQPVKESNTIVNERLELDHCSKSIYKDATSIPIGVPKNAIAGILISKTLEKNENAIKQIIKNFPDQYITTPDGELIYEPQKNLEITNDSMKAIAKGEEVALEKANAQQDFKNLEKEKSLEEMDLIQDQEEN